MGNHIVLISEGIVFLTDSYFLVGRAMKTEFFIVNTQNPLQARDNYVHFTDEKLRLREIKYLTLKSQFIRKSRI